MTDIIKLAKSTGARLVRLYDKDGNEFFSSTYSDGMAVLWLLERLKQKLLTVYVDA